MDKKRALCIIGDYYHSPGRIRDILVGNFLKLGIDGLFITDPQQAPWESLKEFDLLVMAGEERIEPQISNRTWNTREHEEKIQSFVQNGGSLFVLHAGLAYQPEGPYFDTVKGCFQFHPKEHPVFSVVPAAQIDDWFAEDFELEIKDEMYFCRIKSAETRVLMYSKCSDYGSSPAAWAHQYGNGNVFAFTPGHNTEVFQNPLFRSVVTKGLSWCMKKD